MTRPQLNSGSQHLNTLLHAGSSAGLTDGQLLERFVLRRGTPMAEQAFEALVMRHARLVRGICQGLLRDDQDADDAFQATFVILARRAGSLWVRHSLSPWLYTVARRVARRARAQTARRKRREVGWTDVAIEHREPDCELRWALHEEVGRLPCAYREVVVLCYLEGRTCEEAARHLGCPVGTVKTRLSRARERLRQRLDRRGLNPSTAFLALPLRGAADATRIPELARSLVRRVLAGSGLPDRVDSLAIATRRELKVAVLKPVGVAVLAVLAIGTAGVALHRGHHSPAHTVSAERRTPQTFAPLELSPKTNRLLTDDLGGVGENSLSSLPRGKAMMAGLPFTIGPGMIHLAGDGAPGNQGDRGPVLPGRVRGIAVAASASRLHLLQAVHFDGRKDGVVDGTEVAALVVHYADRSQKRVPLVYGVDVRDWWYRPDQLEPTRAAVAWTGTNPASRERQQAIRLFAATWTNPHPGRRVASIDLESSRTRAEPIVVAATAEVR